ncbi:hypothetical protein FF38_02858 [Lucilia cuprina]|uniref:MADF domain-containing protein n=1 Tax=Lucilia cuprina TaxID=7375 RepID=A0A0L0CQS5_LUCCU|nr:hypothetical protein FF38_02858 [Lucilia cuprina]
MRTKTMKGLDFEIFQAAVLALVKTWKSKECLYNPKHEFYHKKHARAAALDTIATNLKQIILNISLNDIDKNKLSSLSIRCLKSGRAKKVELGLMMTTNDNSTSEIDDQPQSLKRKVGTH